MKKALISSALGLTILLISSCKKDNYCYSCVAQGTKSWNFNQQVSKQECDLIKSERDDKANEFEWAYPTESWNTSCTRTSE